MQRIRVGVLRGGPSDEYEVSLQSGATILKHAPEDIYEIQDIFIAKDGTWHRSGVPVEPHIVISHVDVVWNALHGHYGEDGKVQHLLEMHQIPFTGSGSFASALGMNKAFTKEVFDREGIKTPQFCLVQSTDNFSEKNIIKLFKVFSLPFIVKPVSSGSSVGVTLVKDFKSFEPALRHALSFGDTVMIEEFINRKEATVGVIDGYRDQELYVLPPIEILPKKDFFDYEAKYSGNESGAEEIVPGNFTNEEKKELEEMARRIHNVLGLLHYSRSDFVVAPRRGIFALETNTLPGMTEASLFPKALHAVGAPISHFIDHIITLALQRK